MLDLSPVTTTNMAFWRGLDELPGMPSQPVTASPADAIPLPPRRDFMKVMAASLALAGTSGCTREPLEKIVPLRDGVDETTTGKPVYYASALARDGYGTGVLVETNMGRPTKIEGNPLHPASLGATDIFAQAAVLELWDPDRSHATLRARAPATWERFLGELRARMVDSRDGRGVAVLTETITSPTLHAQLQAMRMRYPQARWHQYQPLNRDAVYDGSRRAFGVALEPRYRFDKARVVVAFDADFVGSMPGHLRYARDFMAGRRVGGSMPMNRLHAAEASPSLTGAAADHKRAARSADIAALVRAMRGRIAGGRPDRAPDPWLDAAVDDLLQHRGAAIVVAGDRQPAAVHADVHAINDALGNHGTTVELAAPVAFDATSQTQSLLDLVAAMRAGEVGTLLILGGNPVYDSLADADFGQALPRVAWSAHLSLYDDETSFRCTWHVAAAHALETWGDIRAFDGTATIQQPCIAPLYGGHSAHEILSAMADGLPLGAYDAVRAHWRRARPQGFEEFWREALWRGTIGDATPLPARSLDVVPGIAAADPGSAAARVAPPPGIELVFAPDATLGDGRHANNAWLQELPKPLTTLTWDNAATMAPALADRLGLVDGDVVALALGSRSVELPVLVLPDHADASITVHLGHGRSRAGSVGNGVGAAVNPLRTSGAPWIAHDVVVTRTARRLALARTQTHNRMEGRDLVRLLTREEAARCDGTPCAPAHGADPPASLYPERRYDGYKWGMSIDLNACIGCNACTIACQAENNIPVVGKAEVLRGREMHWIRVDRYYAGSRDRPRTLFQPVPCMQCEHAPCEVVCPTAASVHDAEGLNAQVYNRCVGTRFCSNNCPYKVRRFNFLSYTRATPALDAQRNPEVTVRMRGVMEKCTYCTQRITAARIGADRENRRIADGEVITACQAVCPTQAISFGDLNDPASEVARRKASPLDYALLAELNTRPRTTYLPRIVAAAPEPDAT